ncbi:unnamed protein product [Adineta steineri]|uniref:N-acetyltransferase domain-containing protein n=2 Tax=Adineta steineri TaxID=433720 RepID=A0A813R773_9BILA|nr:unnamed protein product [Adineta steineri]
MDTQFVVRRADICDIDALSHICKVTIREASMEELFIPYSEEDLDSYFRSSASPESFAKKINDPQQAVWVIEDKTNGELVAYAVAGPCHIEDVPHPDVCSNKDALLNRLYVRRDWHSRGFGQQLMNVILPWSEEHYPARPLWLTVWSQNFKAQRFYTHYGFTKVGVCDYYVGERKEQEFFMNRQTHKS